MAFLENLLLSRWGGYLVMTLLFGAIVVFLRVLFGPRGFFRDPHWDVSNRELRAEEAAAREARRKAWDEKHGSTSAAESGSEQANPQEPSKTPPVQR